MRLVSVRIQNFKAISDSGSVAVDRAVTVFVGQNEAGKTAFLQALHKARAGHGSGASYDREMDYPRGLLNDYEELHQDRPAPAATLTYELSESELLAINNALGVEALKRPEFTLTHNFDNACTIGIRADEQSFATHLLDKASMPEDEAKVLRVTSTARDLLSCVAGMEKRGVEAEALYQQLTERFGKMPNGWSGADYEIWSERISPAVPSFVYFDEYGLLPGRMNLTSLSQRVGKAGNNPAALTFAERSVLGLLRMARVDLSELLKLTTYESITAKLEAFSNKVTDRVFKYWKQNDQLEVRIDVRQTPGEVPPFNNGPNLEIRIYSKRHRVTVGFDQRSRGFIWFFSFLVWFDSVRQQLGTEKELILLLDEPGLSLHALAQQDFLRYIDDLAERHQTLYTTHSPFMVHGDRLHQVRLVQDRKDHGTIVTDDVSTSDRKTVFPLQAALGYSIAQNLFISKRNLLVEGPADLVYLQQISGALEAASRARLRDDITVVPVGGLENVATFIALLGGSKLELAVVHDVSGKPHQRLEQLIRNKIVTEQQVLNYGMFRSVDGSVQTRKSSEMSVEPSSSGSGRTNLGPAAPSTDVEDLFSVDAYLDIFNATFAKQMGTLKLTNADLPAGDRIVDRINRCLKIKNIELRPSGGFNHYAVATQLAANPPKKYDKDTLRRFELLFEAVNCIFSSAT